MRTQGEGVKNRSNFADVFYGRPLKTLQLGNHKFTGQILTRLIYIYNESCAKIINYVALKSSCVKFEEIHI